MEIWLMKGVEELQLEVQLPGDESWKLGEFIQASNSAAEAAKSQLRKMEATQKHHLQMIRNAMAFLEPFKPIRVDLCTGPLYSQNVILKSAMYICGCCSWVFLSKSAIVLGISSCCMRKKLPRWYLGIHHLTQESIAISALLFPQARITIPHMVKPSPIEALTQTLDEEEAQMEESGNRES
ncbi:hypothetical protein K1719_019030 [Acacia pycnantha]|nr:hypothetical protein K1719_019030 [Acacia pycnantha]